MQAARQSRRMLGTPAEIDTHTCSLYVVTRYAPPLTPSPTPYKQHCAPCSPLPENVRALIYSAELPLSPLACHAGCLFLRSVPQFGREWPLSPVATPCRAFVTPLRHCQPSRQARELPRIRRACHAACEWRWSAGVQHNVRAAPLSPRLRPLAYSPRCQCECASPGIVSGLVW
jgi:hypothetical protein